MKTLFAALFVFLSSSQLVAHLAVTSPDKILTKKEILKVYDASMHETDIQKRDSLYTFVRLQASFAQLDSLYLESTFHYIEDSIIPVSRQDAILLTEDLLFRKHKEMDSTMLAWAHRTLGVLISYEANPSPANIARAGFHARQALKYSKKSDHNRYNALIYHFVQSKNDSALVLIDLLDTTKHKSATWYKVQYYFAVGDLKNQLKYAKYIGGYTLLEAFVNNNLYKSADSLYTLLVQKINNSSPGDYITMHLLAKSLITRGNYKEAEKLLNTAYTFFKQDDWFYEEEIVLMEQKRLYELWNKPKMLNIVLKNYNAFLANQLAFFNENQSEQLALLNTIKVAEFDGLKETEAESHRKDILLLEEENRRNQLVKGFGLFAVILILIGVVYFVYVKQKIKTLKLRQRASFNRMRLDLLRSQFKPHFTFNALSIVNYQLYKKDVAKAEETIILLSNLMRDMLEVLSEPLVTIDQEISFLTHYLSLEKVRVNNAFEYHINVDETLDTQQFYIPGAITQVLVENALKHGLSEMKENALLKIYLKKEAQFFTITVVDNGKGMLDQRAKKHPSRGLGLVKSRMENLSKIFEKPFVFSIKNSNNATGVTATLTFPFITSEEIEASELNAKKWN